jgi:hypothetical protein
LALSLIWSQSPEKIKECLASRPSKPKSSALAPWQPAHNRHIRKMSDNPTVLFPANPGLISFCSVAISTVPIVKKSMRNGFLVLLMVLICMATARAQTPSGPPDAASVAETPPLEGDTASVARETRVWGGIDYLLWWFKGSPLPAPLVSTGNPNAGPLAGNLASPNTQVLFGGSTQEFPAVSGSRLALGAWLTPEPLLGMELTGFFLQRNSIPFQVTSDGSGNPPLYLPAFNVATGKEDSLILSDPVQRFTGSVLVSSVTRLWGVEANGILAAWSAPRLGVQLLAGFRYLDLQENLQLQSTSSDLVNSNQLFLQDNFDTRNQFYGGQLGVRLNFVQNRLAASLTGKLALGSTYQEVDISASATQSGTAAPVAGTFAGGFFTQPSNIGRRSHDLFTVVPEAQVKIGYEISRGWQAFVGYDLLYWNQVVRPGDQIDRNLNLTQSPVFGGGTLVGPAQPAVPFNRSDFWAQGFSFGFVFRF